MIWTAHPSESPDSSAAERRKLVSPLSGTLWFIGMFSLVIMAAGLVAAVAHLAGGVSVAGYGDATVCVKEPRVGVGMDTSAPMLAHDPLFATKPGATVSVDGVISACASHPGAGIHALYALTTTPSALVWLGVLFLLWRLVRAAERSGPFTPLVTRLLRFTGWFIIVGSVLAAAAQGAATDALLNSMLVGHGSFGDAFPQPGPLVGPVLAGIAALTFARIVRLGTRMDQDLQGTI